MSGMYPCGPQPDSYDVTWRVFFREQMVKFETTQDKYERDIETGHLNIMNKSQFVCDKPS